MGARLTHQAAPGFSERIRQAREVADPNRTQFCRRHGLPEVTVKSWERAGYCLTQDSLDRLCAALENDGVLCSANWLLTGEGDPPMKGGTAADAMYRAQVFPPSLVAANQVAGEVPEEAQVLAQFYEAQAAEVLMARVGDEGMRPWMQSTDVIAAQPVLRRDIAGMSGRPCLIEAEHGGYTVRKLLCEDGRFLLIPLNTAYEVKSLGDVRRVARILWQARTLS